MRLWTSQKIWDPYTCVFVCIYIYTHVGINGKVASMYIRYAPHQIESHVQILCTSLKKSTEIVENLGWWPLNWKYVSHVNPITWGFGAIRLVHRSPFKSILLIPAKATKIQKAQSLSQNIYWIGKTYLQIKLHFTTCIYYLSYFIACLLVAFFMKNVKKLETDSWLQKRVPPAKII